MTTDPRVAASFAALADPTRRAVLELVAEGERSVGQLAGQLPVSRPAVSQHLRVLKEAGLVRDRAEGTRRLYHLDPQGLDGLRAYLEGFWSRSLDAFRRVAEASTTTSTPPRPPTRAEQP